MLQNYHPHNLKNEMRNTYMLRVVQTKVSGIMKFGKSGFMLTGKGYGRKSVRDFVP